MYETVGHHKVHQKTLGALKIEAIMKNIASLLQVHALLEEKVYRAAHYRLLQRHQDQL